MSNNKLYISLIIGAVIVVILAIGGYLFFIKFKQPAKAPVLNLKEAAREEITIKPVSLVLNSDKKEAKVGDLIKVMVNLDLAGQKTNGVDIVIKYDPQLIKIEPINPKAKKISIDGRVEPKDYLDVSSSSFNIFPYLKIDNLSNLVSFSALADPQKEISGEGNVVVLMFKAVKKGTANIEIVFQKDANSDSNVAYGGKDILGKVFGVNIDIK